MKFDVWLRFCFNIPVSITTTCINLLYEWKTYIPSGFDVLILNSAKLPSPLVCIKSLRFLLSDAEKFLDVKQARSDAEKGERVLISR